MERFGHAFFQGILGQPAQSAVVQYDYHGQEMQGVEDAEGRTMPGLRIRLDLDLGRLGLTSLSGQSLHFPDPGVMFPTRSAFFGAMGYWLSINNAGFPADMSSEFSVSFDDNENIVDWRLALVDECSPQDCFLFVNHPVWPDLEFLSVYNIDGSGLTEDDFLIQQRNFHFVSASSGTWEKVPPIPLPASFVLLASALGLLVARRFSPALHTLHPRRVAA
jgi:hypothetical protein